MAGFPVGTREFSRLQSPGKAGSERGQLHIHSFVGLLGVHRERKKKEDKLLLVNLSLLFDAA
jgi:hypothetical protein